MVNWVPERRDIIWINCSPQTGNEIPNIHQFLVLSEAKFNDKTSLVLGLPMTTASYNADNPFALPIGKVQKQDELVEGYILCHQVKSFDWRKRSAKPHPMKKLDMSYFSNARAILNQIIQL